MASTREIRKKVASITSTRKITSAMEMVAASKMRRAADLMEQTRPYRRGIEQLVSHLASASAEYRNAYMQERASVKSVGIILVSTDRGLCGGLNANLFRRVLTQLGEWDDKGIKPHFSGIGVKGCGFIRRLGYPLVSQATNLGDRPNVNAIVAPLKVMLNQYAEGKIDALYLASNTYVNTMTQKPGFARLLPLVPDSMAKSDQKWDYIYEPDARELLDALIQRYVESVLYQAILENISCEQAAKMIAMKSASDNAQDLIDELQLKYNNARQAAITQELSEIVGGAAAV